MRKQQICMDIPTVAEIRSAKDKDSKEEQIKRRITINTMKASVANPAAFFHSFFPGRAVLTAILIGCFIRTGCFYVRSPASGFTTPGRRSWTAPTKSGSNTSPKTHTLNLPGMNLPMKNIYSFSKHLVQMI